MVGDDCHYCGFHSNNFLNGIDRMNNLIGYTKENSVACCQVCNRMKNTLNKETFILMCIHITIYNKSKMQRKLYPEIFNNYRDINYTRYELRGQLKFTNFGLSEEKFNEIMQRKICYICGKENTKKHMNGIDRKDNTMSYTYDNCQLCCGNCNYLKKDYDYDFFLFTVK